MVILKNYTCAFLEKDNKFLLMKRSPDRDLNPNFWSGVGGKIEPIEINDPYKACLREIYEETGINSKDINNLKLRYIIIRRHKDTIRQSYVYFGNTIAEEITDTDEGTLYWIAKENLSDKKFTSTFIEMIKHYLSPLSDDNNIFVGTAENRDGALQMCWSKIEDFID